MQQLFKVIYFAEWAASAASTPRLSLKHLPAATVLAPFAASPERP
jgi:hypothetical protein